MLTCYVTSLCAHGISGALRSGRWLSGASVGREPAPGRADLEINPRAKFEMRACVSIRHRGCSMQAAPAEFARHWRLW